MVTIKTCKTWHLKAHKPCELCKEKTQSTQIIFVKKNFLVDTPHHVCDVHLSEWMESNKDANNWKVKPVGKCERCEEVSTHNLIVDIDVMSAKRFPLCKNHITQWTAGKLNLDIGSDMGFK